MVKIHDITLQYIVYNLIVFDYVYDLKEGKKCFIIMTHLTHFISGYMASDIW